MNGIRAAVVATTLALVVAAAAAAAPVHMVVTPATVSAGGEITVSARSSPCPRRDQITLISTAFPGHVFGKGAVYGRVGEHGAFRVRARIRPLLRPGRYQIGGRCGGGNLGVSVYVRVR